MAWHLERALQYRRDRIEGWVNVPAGGEALAQVEHDPNVRDSVLKTHLHVARPAGHNHPTADGVRGTEEMLRLVASAGPDDVAFCLLSGGGSALLPAPVEGITLKDKQSVTKSLHACGATIHEMNAIRKHLSRVKGGRLAAAFEGRLLLSLIISDVVGDPLDVIASGPTAPDPTTFADSLAVIERYGLRARDPEIRDRRPDSRSGRRDSRNGEGPPCDGPQSRHRVQHGRPGGRASGCERAGLSRGGPRTVRRGGNAACRGGPGWSCPEHSRKR